MPSFQGVEKCGAEQVPAHAAHHPDVRSEPRGRDGLRRPLATWGSIEAFALKGLSRSGSCANQAMFMPPSATMLGAVSGLVMGRSDASISSY